MKLLTLLLLAPTLLLAKTAKAPPTPLALGSTAPDFTLPNVDGTNVSLQDFAKSPYLAVIFTCNHCPDAIASTDRIKALHKNYTDQGLAIVMISGNDPQALLPWELGFSIYGDSAQDMKLWHQEQKLPCPYLYDGGTQSTTLAYGALATPHAFLFNAQRKLLYQGRISNGRRTPGLATENNLRDALDLSLAGKEIPQEQATTRPFGCSTKWSWKRANAQKNEADWTALPTTVETLATIDDAKAMLDKTKGLRLINIWSTTCGPCLAEMPELINIYRQYHRRGLDLITIAIDPPQNNDDVLQTLKKFHLPLSPFTHKKYAKAPSETPKPTTPNYHYTGDLDALANHLDKSWPGPIPQTILLDANGTLLWSHNGQIDPTATRRQILKALSSPPHQ